MEAFLSKIQDQTRTSEKKRSLIVRLEKSIIGRDITVTTALGLERRLVYCDYFASGRPLSLIEDAIRHHILPMYGNTHTTSTASGKFMTQQRELARNVVHESVNADDSYVTVFTGPGSTSAILHLVAALRLNDSGRWSPSNPPVVFASLIEHHSNLLPWRDSCAQVVTIPMDSQGVGPCLTTLAQELARYQESPLLIGAFSAGSNLTGIPIQVHRIADLLHRHDALAFFDFAGIGPYCPINVVGSGNGLDHLDAVFLSPHKFLGGPGTPGVLVANRSLLRAGKRPARPGGGTVVWVTKDNAAYTSHLEEREEAGTPDIVGSIRCGMVFALKDAIGGEFIQHKEFETAGYVLRKIKDTMPNVRVFGNTMCERVPVITFNIFSPLVDALSNDARLMLHHDFVSTLLNDLFGIQSRSGCMCAGPYSHYLLGIDDAGLQAVFSACTARPLSHQDSGIESASSRSPSSFATSTSDSPATWLNVFKPGFVRLSFNYFTNPKEIDYVLDAIWWITANGHLMLPYYSVDFVSGAWTVSQVQQDLVSKVSRTVGKTSGARFGVAAKWFPIMQKRSRSRSFADAQAFVQPELVKAASMHLYNVSAGQLSHERIGHGGYRPFALPEDVCRFVMKQ
ncbi:pyridoxal phosphate-dependent transferase [Catenaria anguillulae PL171]|uniref:Pyridoxal phosphate-dependent transferase n=1 Tax=Catenaria anguillulae PL171 TaxID=765915 RepID=A0A1Y2H489_9FUNG|nr:pyridoxal phosphate-dependent transferase [Catenaria anguillulae PL171]